jgi:hypothetical protein
MNGRREALVVHRDFGCRAVHDEGDRPARRRDARHAGAPAPDVASADGELDRRARASASLRGTVAVVTGVASCKRREDGRADREPGSRLPTRRVIP